jgi:hypothetical protein
MLEVNFTDDIALWLHSWYVIFEVLVLGGLLEYAWVCGFLFCVWGGLSLLA